MSSEFVKMLGKEFGHSLFVHYVVLALGFHVASRKLDKGGELRQFAGKITTKICVNTLFCSFIHGIVMLLMPFFI